MLCCNFLFNGIPPEHIGMLYDDIIPNVYCIIVFAFYNSLAYDDAGLYTYWEVGKDIIYEQIVTGEYVEDNSY